MQHSSRKNDRNGFSGKKRTGSGPKSSDRKSKPGRSGHSSKEDKDQPAWKKYSREDRPRKHDSEKRGEKRSGGFEKRDKPFKPSHKKEERHYRPFDKDNDRSKKRFGGKDSDKKDSSKYSPERKSGERKHFEDNDRPRKRFGDKDSDKKDSSKYSSEKKSGGFRRSDDNDRPRKRFGDKDSDKKDSSKYSSERKSGGFRRSDDNDRPRKRFSDKDSDKKDSSKYSSERKSGERKHFEDNDRPRKRFSDDDSSKKSHSFDKKREGPRRFDRDNDRPKKRFGDKGYKKHGSPKDAPKKDFDGLTRLNKYLSNAGICSRREADELIKAGAVKVNGVVVTEMGFKIKSTDVVNYGGETLRNERKVYILLNKPKDYITTTDDPQERHTVMELIHGACKERVYPVGRLDRNTLGLLLFTNDGEMATKLMHPKFNVRKVYQVTLNRNIKPDDFAQLEEGVELEDGFIKPDEVSYISENKKELGIEIHSGKNRIVRRIFEHLDYEVVKLDRVAYAGLTKKDLPRGKWRFLSEREVGFLKMIG